MPSSVASGVDTLAVMDTMPLASSTSPSRRNTDVSPRLSRVTRTRLSMYSTSNQPRPNGGSHRFLSAHFPIDHGACPGRVCIVFLCMCTSFALPRPCVLLLTVLQQGFSPYHISQHKIFSLTPK